MTTRITTVRHLFERGFVLMAACFLVLATVTGCSEEPGTEPDAGDPDPADTGDAGSSDVDEPEDTGPDDDADVEEPEPTCDDINCSSTEVCYHGSCFDTCDSDLDCPAEGELCNAGRCVAEDCSDLDCEEGTECFRGRCYEECARSSDCDTGGGITCEDGACVPLDDQCEGIECYQVRCPDGQTTTVTGTVKMPSGELPVAEATVFVPTEELEELPEGATCDDCDDMITGEALVQNQAGTDGKFELPNFPVAEDVPLVVQLGKWRREVEVPEVDPCTSTELDSEYTRLPKNQDEGNMPRLAIATGNCDNLECLTRDIGIDEDEFTTDDGDGAVHLFHGNGASSFAGGDQYTDGEDWWIDADQMLEYDVFLHSCECSENPEPIDNDLTRLAFETFLNQGGRAFVSHYQYTWYKYGTPALQDIAEWDGPGFSGSGVVEVDTSHDGGQEMEDWLNEVNALDGSGQMSINNPRYSVSWVDETLTQDWLVYVQEQLPNYFSAEMPLGTTAGEDACGRAVFSDLHVSSGSSQPFPNGCVGNPGDLDNQEKALAYMLFDLSGCDAPECEPVGCEEVKGECGIHPDTCGGTIDCGECCAGIGDRCESDGECCDGLSCNMDIEECEQ